MIEHKIYIKHQDTEKKRGKKRGREKEKEEQREGENHRARPTRKIKINHEKEKS